MSRNVCLVAEFFPLYLMLFCSSFHLLLHCSRVLTQHANLLLSLFTLLGHLQTDFLVFLLYRPQL